MKVKIGIKDKDESAEKKKEKEPEEVKENWTEIGRTETIDNNLNPNWVKHFDVAYEFHKNRRLKFEVLDEDDNQNHDLIGSCETTLLSIMMAER